MAVLCNESDELVDRLLLKTTGESRIWAWFDKNI